MSSRYSSPTKFIVASGSRNPVVHARHAARNGAPSPAAPDGGNKLLKKTVEFSRGNHARILITCRPFSKTGLRLRCAHWSRSIAFHRPSAPADHPRTVVPQPFRRPRQAVHRPAVAAGWVISQRADRVAYAAKHSWKPACRLQPSTKRHRCTSGLSRFHGWVICQHTIHDHVHDAAEDRQLQW